MAKLQKILLVCIILCTLIIFYTTIKVNTLDNHLSSTPNTIEFTEEIIWCNNFVNQLENISNVSYYKKSQIIIIISYYFISDL